MKEAKNAFGRSHKACEVKYSLRGKKNGLEKVFRSLKQRERMKIQKKTQTKNN